MSLLTEVIEWLESAKKWVIKAGGYVISFISGKAIQDEMEAHLTASASTLQALTEQVYAGGLSIAEWQAAVALELKNAYLAQAMLAVGGRANMGAADFGRVGQTLKEQYGFLSQFAQGIADGSVSQGQANVRLGMYVDGSTQSYWDAWRANKETNTELSHLPLLKASPGDGSTECLTRCRCFLQENEDGSIDWIDNDDDAECDGCATMAAKGPYRAK